jgi:hypothetical protein
MPNVFINPIEEINRGFYGQRDKRFEYAKAQSQLQTEALQREQTQAYLDYVRGLNKPAAAAVVTPYATGLTPLQEGKAAAEAGRPAPRTGGGGTGDPYALPATPRGSYNLPSTPAELFGPVAPAPPPAPASPYLPTAATDPVGTMPKPITGGPAYLQPWVEQANRRAEENRPLGWTPASVMELFSPTPPATLAPGYLEQAGFRMFGTAPQVDPYAVAGQPGVRVPPGYGHTTTNPRLLAERIQSAPTGESVSLDPFDPTSVQPLVMPTPELTALSSPYDDLPRPPPPPPMYRGDYQPARTGRGVPNVPMAPSVPGPGVPSQPPPYGAGDILPAMSPPISIPPVFRTDNPNLAVAPTQPTYSEPTQPRYAVLNQPTYPAGPAQPTYAVAAQPTYAAPSQPTYSAPAQPTYTPLPLPPEAIPFYMMLPSSMREHFLRVTGYTDPVTGRPPLPLAKFTRNELGLLDSNDEASRMANRAARSAGIGR